MPETMYSEGSAGTFPQAILSHTIRPTTIGASRRHETTKLSYTVSEGV